MKSPVPKKEYIPDNRPDASGRKKPRAGSTGPNGVANKFLAQLRGGPVKIWDLAQADRQGPPFMLRGVLVEFDSYSIKLRQEDGELCIWKGPGLVVEPDDDLSKGDPNV